MGIVLRRELVGTQRCKHTRAKRNIGTDVSSRCPAEDAHRYAGSPLSVASFNHVVCVVKRCVL